MPANGSSGSSRSSRRKPISRRGVFPNFCARPRNGVLPGDVCSLQSPRLHYLSPSAPHPPPKMRGASVRSSHAWAQRAAWAIWKRQARVDAAVRLLQNGGNEEEIVATLNVKNLPDTLYRKLKARAKRERRSVAQEVAVILSQALEPA